MFLFRLSRLGNIFKTFRRLFELCVNRMKFSSLFSVYLVLREQNCCGPTKMFENSIRGLLEVFFLLEKLTI